MEKVVWRREGHVAGGEGRDESAESCSEVGTVSVEVGHEECIRLVGKEKDNVSGKCGGRGGRDGMTDNTGKEFGLKGGDDKGGASPVGGKGVVCSAEKAISRMERKVRGCAEGGDGEG